MEFILNEESLAGQFTTVQDFLMSLRNNLLCFNIIRKNENNTISKTENFYECNVTNDTKIRDLKGYGCSDELVDFQLQLEKEIYNIPFWDKNPLHDLSKTYLWNGVQSIYSPLYLVNSVGKQLKMNRDDILKIRYEGTRIDCSSIESKYGAEELDDSQFQQVISSMDKFANHETWADIEHDDGLEYKKYKPSSPKYDWYNGSMYKNKQIMKFRASSVLRVHGYRKGDRFRVLRIETDHKYSDHG